MSSDYPACVCADHYPGASSVHPPDCPVRQTIDRLTRERDAACDDVGELTETLLAIAARLGVEPVNLANGADCLEAIDRLTRERDEARAEVKALRGWLDLCPAAKTED